MRTNRKTWGTADSESGSVLVIALMMLVFLTMIGIAATTTTSIELQIARNERIYAENFNHAEAAARHAIQLIENMTAADLSDHDAFPWLHNGELTDLSLVPDFTNPDNWTLAGSDVNAGSMSDAMGAEFNDTYFAAIDRLVTGEEDLTLPSKMHLFQCFGNYNHPTRGRVLIEVGYKRRY